MPHPFRLYNTLTRNIEDFVPIQPGRVGLYVCGMTVYADAHVGHARAMVVFDAFVRYLRHRSWNVTFVRNFTDIDDKIIHRAAERGEDPLALAESYINAFHDEAVALGLLPPDHEPRVTRSIPEIQAMIQVLLDKGNAYTAEGSVWFSVRTYPQYGCLSGQKVDELRSADDVPGKRDPADFALWKAAKPGEPAWDSPWGPGRPGWHIECSAMARHSLGQTLDIHGGGLDLVFPHHENEIAQSECANSKTYVQYWMHNGLLTMSGGQKMGKSLGNVINLHDALASFPAEALRLYYLQNHYRSPLPWSSDALPDALGMLMRLYDARETAETMSGDEDADQVASSLGDDAKAVLDLGRAFPDRFHAAMDSDFNTAMALGAMFELARAINRFGRNKKAKRRGGPVVAPALASLALVRDALGLMAMDTRAFHEEVKNKRLGALGVDRGEVEARLAERADARQRKDWTRADAIREELEAKNIMVMDTPEGVEWRVRVYHAAD